MKNNACLRHFTYAISILAVSAALLTISTSHSFAKLCDQNSGDGDTLHSTISNTCHGTRVESPGKKPNSTADQHSSTNSYTSTTPVKKTKTPQQIYAEKVAAIQKHNKALLDNYHQQLADRNRRYANGDCVFKGGGQSGGPDCGNVVPPTLTDIPKPAKPTKNSPAPPAPAPMPLEEAAYQAISTKLQINASGVGIGPDPDLSKWNMAVVGHPYWLWATGPTHLGPVSDSASGRTVTLQANLTSVTFDMGDGNTVKCDGPGTPYPGDKDGLYSKSPTCGYTYTTTSRHHAGGTYPVRATTYWSVTYTAPDGNGTIPIVLATERDLKVGELQTVVVH